MNAPSPRTARVALFLALGALAATVIAASVLTSASRARPFPEADARAAPSALLRIRVVDPDRALPMPARIVVRPSQGSAVDALVRDVRNGEADVPVPSGAYRVAASRGIEWSIDVETVHVAAPDAVDVELRPRRVVESETFVGCDLNIRRDASVTRDERVVSALAADIALGVVMDEEVSDYGPALSRTDLTGKVGWLSGLEIRTAEPAFGDIAVFPLVRGDRRPSGVGTTAEALFSSVHADGAEHLIVVRHPRTNRKDGYFDVLGVDPTRAVLPPAASTAFDLLEVFSGDDLSTPARIEEVLRDWLALLADGRHVIAIASSGTRGQGAPWLGSPRTVVDIGRWRQGYAGGPLDVDATLAALRNGHGFVTNGPTIELTVHGSVPDDEDVNRGADTVLSANKPGEAKPGTVVQVAPLARAHVRVRAPEWMDVSTIEVVADGVVVQHLDLSPHPVATGKENGSREEATERATRFDRDIAVAVAPRTRSLVAVARGTTIHPDAALGVIYRPIAFTNPIWLRPAER